MNSPFHNIGIVTRPNTPEIQNTAHTLIHFLQDTASPSIWTKSA